MTLQAGGALTQSGALAVTGTTGITAGANNITLDTATNNFTGAVSVVSGNDVSLRDTNALVLGASTVSGNLTLQSGGTLTQTGALAVTGTTGITAGANNITLDTATNNFTGAVSVVSGNDVSLRDTNALVLGASNVSGNLTLQSGGALTQTGALAVTGTTGITAGANNITLDTATNNFTGAVSVVSGAAVSIKDANSITLGNMTTSGNLSIEALGGGGIELTGLLNAGSNTLTLNSTGTITDTGSGTITAGSLALLNASSVTLDATTNNVGTLASSGTGALTYVDSNALTIGTVNPTGITATGPVSIATLTGDLTVSENISTTDTSTGAIILNAGKNTAAGTSTGGNLVVTGSPTVTTGAGGRSTLMTGSVAGSTGLAALASAGNYRYNSDEFAANYTTALGAGTFAVYREQPTVTVTAAAASKTYDGLAYTGGNGVNYSGFVNSETTSVLSGAVAYSGTSQGATNAGTYVITPGGLSNGLGYALAYTNGTLTITQAASTPTTPTILPPVISTTPVVLIVPSSGGLVDGNSSTDDGGAGAGAAGASGISISLDNSQADGSTNQSALTEVVTVLVPRSMTTSGTGFRFELPAQIRASLGNGEVAASLADGGALPGWISFDPATVSFTATAVPDRGLPLRVRISTAVREILVIVSERNE